MKPICVINNFGQFNHLIHRALRDMEIEAVMLKNDTPMDEIMNNYRGIILGGGPSLERSGLGGKYLDLDLPVLGICLGMHIIATTEGGTVKKGNFGGYGAVEVDILNHDVLLEGYPNRISVWASHADEVSRVPKGFETIAQSQICNVEAIANYDKNIYGVQWHPEVSHTENGRLLFENFNKICE